MKEILKFFMRLRAKVDNNQKEIVMSLRAAGFQVIHMHMIGRGFPDIIACRAKKCWFIEIKDGPKASFTSAQVEFYMDWQGPSIIVLTSIADVDAFIANPTKYPNKVMKKF